MPSNPRPGASKDKVYRANPAPVKDPDFDKLGVTKGQMADNRDLKEAPKDG